MDAPTPPTAPADPPRRNPWVRLLRLSHWSKNVLLGVPFLMAGAWKMPGALTALVLAFVAFSLVASASYVLNDMADLSFDRAHATKRHRPLAAGAIGIVPALVAALALAAVGLAMALVVGRSFLFVLFAYVLLTTAYTRSLKRLALVDVLALSALWTLRLLAGAAAIGVELSVWLLSFGAFLFLSLALVKRVAELGAATVAPGVLLPGRGYCRDDRAALEIFGIATGVVSVLVLALFVDSSGAQLRYPHHARLWLVCPAIWFWLGRLWLMTGRGVMNEDPLEFSLHDRPSWLALGVVACVWLAALGIPV